MITGTYNLVADPSWSLAQFQEVRLECDTTLGPVTINLPAISTLTQSTNIKLFIVDATANASVNNITINAGTTGLPPVSDTFDDSTTTTLVLNTNGSSVIFQNVAATQWIATESVSSGGGTSNPFGVFFSTTPTTYNITDAIEGTSIPNGVSDSYTKTIPLNSFTSAITTALVVFNAFEVADNCFTFTFYCPANGYGVTSPGAPSLNGAGTLGYTMLESVVRLLVTNDYTKTLRPQPFSNTPIVGFKEVDENGAALISGTNPNYSEIGGTLIGSYAYTNLGVGYTSDNSVNSQNNSVIKSAYLDTSGPTPNLVLLLKKKIATVGINWASLEMNVYDLSA